MNELFATTSLLLLLAVLTAACEGHEVKDPSELAISLWGKEDHGAPSARCADEVRGSVVTFLGTNDLAAQCEFDDPGVIMGCMYRYDTDGGRIAVQSGLDQWTERLAVTHEMLHVLFHCSGQGDEPANWRHEDGVWGRIYI